MKLSAPGISISVKRLSLVSKRLQVSVGLVVWRITTHAFEKPIDSETIANYRQIYATDFGERASYSLANCFSSLVNHYYNQNLNKLTFLYVCTINVIHYSKM
jgi:hypothetical protein